MEFLYPSKRHLYEQYLKMLHLNELYTEHEIDMFRQQAREQQIDMLSNNITSVHVIDCIGDYEPINHTGIVKKMDLSKASITNICSKLLETDFIRRSQLNNNRKEIYFSLTDKGRRVYHLHKKLHQEKEEGFYQFIESYSETELQTIGKFMSDLLARAEQLYGREVRENDDLKD
ncbi:MarR family transcriptional regulator [Paenibacillus sp. alder61]|uniref:MarR family transcriptional regulator n=1 Tax=Paenibacillus sp. alder61 TaxID=2862948 RepID=UPI001CD1EE26|nr:MarR family transcriptional regulator [Paenibacillus sp. alder61]MCA1295159.1 MarR family transcriptional regulator [Paenibacillus sp. alder61]